VVAAPWASNVPVVLGLVAIYYTVIRSFVSWHGAIEQRRYRLSVPDVRTTELCRVYIDALIVLVYAYLLLKAEPLRAQSDADIAGLLWAFPMLFVLYGTWGYLRRVAWGPDDFKLRVLIKFAVAYSVLALLYQLDPAGIGGSAVANSFALACVLMMMGAYRFINFWQGADVNRWRGLPLPRIPTLTVLDRDGSAPEEGR